jgi:cytochrome c oxidase subunit II
MAAAKIIVFEKAFLATGLVLLGLCLVALLYTSVAMGITLPGRAGGIDPAAVNTTPPFDQPGVRQVGPNRYEVVVIGYAWGYTPRDIRVPVGAEVTFISTSRDVIHGLNVEGTRVNVMLIPGQISRVNYVFRQPGEFLLICHEFCGLAHHAMYGRVFAIDREEFDAEQAAREAEQEAELPPPAGEPAAPAGVGAEGTEPAGDDAAPAGAAADDAVPTDA